MKLTNNNARYGWGFAACFLLMCVAFTYILFRDGPSNIPISPSIPGFYPPWVMPAVLAVFWMGGLGLAAYLTEIPCVTIEVLASGAVRIRKRYPFKSESRTVPASEIAAVDIVQTTDDEGDLYFRVRLTTADDFSVDIAESSDRAVCEAAMQRFNAALASAAAA